MKAPTKHTQTGRMPSQTYEEQNGRIDLELCDEQNQVPQCENYSNGKTEAGPPPPTNCCVLPYRNIIKDIEASIEETVLHIFFNPVIQLKFAFL